MSRREFFGWMAALSLAASAQERGVLPHRMPERQKYRPIPGLERDWFAEVHEQNIDLRRFCKGFRAHGAPSGKATEWKKYSREGGIGRELDEQNVNSAAHLRDSSGAAAAATLMRLHEATELSGDELTNRIYAGHPPDVLGVSSPDRVAQSLVDNKMRVVSAGKDTEGVVTMLMNLKDAIRWGYPTAILLDLGPLSGYRYKSPHWTVAFAFDDRALYCTNWDYQTMSNGWNDVLAAWAMPRAPEWANWAVIGWRQEE